MSPLATIGLRLRVVVVLQRSAVLTRQRSLAPEDFIRASVVDHHCVDHRELFGPGDAAPVQLNRLR